MTGFPFDRFEHKLLLFYRWPWSRMAKLLAGIFILILASIVKKIVATNFKKLACKISCIEKEKKQTLQQKFKSISCITKECKLCSRYCRVKFNFNRNCTTQCHNSPVQDKEICKSQCAFLKEKNRIGKKPGECPKVLVGFQVAEVATCESDDVCPGTEKCCVSKTKKTCQTAHYIYNSSYPPVPVNLRAVKKSASSILVTWQFPSNTTWRNATMFVVERRHTTRVLRPSSFEYTFWNQVGQTASMRTLMKGLVPGDWYQFRVAAYSKDGTNGFSRPSFGIRLNSAIRRPSAPRNFKADKAWYEEDKISVNITWTPPLVLDIPPRRYRIQYSKYVEGSSEHYNIIPIEKIKVPGTQTHVILPSLSPNAIYLIKVQAMLSVRKKRVKGRWGVMYLKTPPPAKQKDPKANGTSTFTPMPSITKSNPLVVKTEVEVHLVCKRVFFATNGFLSALLQWSVPEKVEGIQLEYKPIRCKQLQPSIVRKRLVNADTKEITLTDLYPHCSYLVEMTPFCADRSPMRKKSIYFSTEVTATTATTSKTDIIAKMNESKNDATGLHSRYIFIFLITLCSLFILLL